MNINIRQVINPILFEYAYSECGKHKECIDCRMIDGKPLQENEMVLICETGIEKNNNSKE